MNAQTALRFRTPMPVTAVALYRSGDSFPICPQCGISMEREYQRFCDRCGQRLDWKGFRRAEVIQKF